MQYKQTTFLFAKQLERSMVLRTFKGATNAKAGDYLCVTEHGEEFIIPRLIFEREWVATQSQPVNVPHKRSWINCAACKTTTRHYQAGRNHENRDIWECGICKTTRLCGGELIEDEFKGSTNDQS